MSRSDGAYNSAEGDGNKATGNPSHAEGIANTASGLASHAECGQGVGPCNVASGPASHVEGGGRAGGGNTASGVNSHAEGNANLASGGESHAEGSGNIASGERSHAEGTGSTASGNDSNAGGYGAHSSRMGQLARSSGVFDALSGTAQSCQEYLMLETVDANPAILRINGNGGAASLFILEDDKSYNYEIMVIARSNAAGISSAFKITGACKMVSGVTSQIGAVPATVNIANDGGASAVWTATAAAVVATDSLDITVTTGGAAQTVRWMAVINWVEVSLVIPH
jgi:hypothetical protein